jgi:hypothetical protein
MQSCSSSDEDFIWTKTARAKPVWRELYTLHPGILKRAATSRRRIWLWENMQRHCELRKASARKPAVMP